MGLRQPAIWLAVSLLATAGVGFTNASDLASLQIQSVSTSSVQPGGRVDFSVWVQNVGTTTWSPTGTSFCQTPRLPSSPCVPYPQESGYFYLLLQFFYLDAANPFDGNSVLQHIVPMPYALTPGQSTTVTGYFNAPTSTGRWGFTVQMVKMWGYAFEERVLSSASDSWNLCPRYEFTITSCSPPGAFSLTSPSSGQTLASGTSSTTLQWGTASGASSYDVYFGTSSSPPLLANQTGTSRSVSVANGQTYYWRVVAKNSCGSTSSTGSTRSFSVANSGGGTNVIWLPVASRAAGANNSQWRSDLGITNPNPSAANFEVRFHGSSGVLISSAFVSANGQSILQDVVGQLGGTGSGAIEVRADQPVRITGRTYNQVSPSAGCYPGGTLGQDYIGFTAQSGLANGETGILGQLTENSAYRTNVGLTNAGAAQATVTVTLYDGAGGQLTSYTVTLNPGEWKQENQPFRNKAGQTNMQRGWAKVTVTSGSGIYAYASVIDNITNDPTTIPMQR